MPETIAFGLIIYLIGRHYRSLSLPEQPPRRFIVCFQRANFQVAALHLEIGQQRRARVLRSSVSFRLVTFIDRILANFIKSGTALISL